MFQKCNNVILAERSILDDPLKVVVNDNNVSQLQINPNQSKCQSDLEVCCSVKDVKPDTTESPTTPTAPTASTAPPITPNGKNPNSTLDLNPINDTGKKEVSPDTVGIVDKPPTSISNFQRPESSQGPTSQTQFSNSNFGSTLSYSTYDNVPYSSYASQPSSPYQDIPPFYTQNYPQKVVQSQDLFPPATFSPSISYDSKYTIPHKQSSVISSTFYTQNSPTKVVQSQALDSPTISYVSYGTQFPTSYEKFSSIGTSFYTQNRPTKVTQYSSPYEKFPSIGSSFYTKNIPPRVVPSQGHVSPTVTSGSYGSQYSGKPYFSTDPLSQFGSSLAGEIKSLLSGLGSGGLRLTLNLR